MLPVVCLEKSLSLFKINRTSCHGHRERYLAKYLAIHYYGRRSMWPPIYQCLAYQLARTTLLSARTCSENLVCSQSLRIAQRPPPRVCNNAPASSHKKKVQLFSFACGRLWRTQAMLAYIDLERALLLCLTYRFAKCVRVVFQVLVCGRGICVLIRHLLFYLHAAVCSGVAISGSPPPPPAFTGGFQRRIAVHTIWAHQ